MDAQAYLRKHGWRGDGHSLDQSGRGIKKPLLVSKKVDVLGVGLNKHAAVSDQWWLRAFDNGLKNFGTGQESMLAAVQKHGVNRGGLYGRFVKGEGVAGTFEKPVSSPDQETSSVPVTTTAPAHASSDRKKNDRKRRHTEEATEKQSSKKHKASLAAEEQRRSKISHTAEAFDTEAEPRGIISNRRQKKNPVETDPDEPDDTATECEQIDVYFAKKHGLALGQYRSQLASGALQRSSTDLSSIDSAKLAEYQARASAKGVPIEAYVQRREEKYAARQGKKLIKDGFQVHPQPATLTEMRPTVSSNISGTSTSQEQPIGSATSSIALIHSGERQFQIAEPSTTTENQRTGGGKAKNAAKMKKAAKKEKHAALQARKATKKETKATKKAKQADQKGERADGKKKGAKEGRLQGKRK